MRSKLWSNIKVYHLRINERVRRTQTTEREKQELQNFADNWNKSEMETIQ